MRTIMCPLCRGYTQGAFKPWDRVPFHLAVKPDTEMKLCDAENDRSCGGSISAVETHPVEKSKTMDNEDEKLAAIGSFINKSRVRSYVLDQAAQLKKLASTGEPRFTRVSAEFLTTVEGDVRALLDRKIAQLTSSGRTI